MDIISTTSEQFIESERWWNYHLYQSMQKVHNFLCLFKQFYISFLTICKCIFTYLTCIGTTKADKNVLFFCLNTDLNCFNYLVHLNLLTKYLLLLIIGTVLGILRPIGWRDLVLERWRNCFGYYEDDFKDQLGALGTLSKGAAKDHDFSSPLG